MGALSALFIILGIILMGFAAFRVKEIPLLSWFPAGVMLWAIGMSITGIALVITTVK